MNTKLENSLIKDIAKHHTTLTHVEESISTLIDEYHDLQEELRINELYTIREYLQKQHEHIETIEQDIDELIKQKTPAPVSYAKILLVTFISVFLFHLLFTV